MNTLETVTVVLRVLGILAGITLIGVNIIDSNYQAVFGWAAAVIAAVQLLGNDIKRQDK